DWAITGEEVGVLKKPTKNRGRQRVYQGETLAVLPSPPLCCFPGCIDFGIHKHHVTYDPKVIKPLCRRHHEEITMINGVQGRKYRHGLSNQHRWWIWYKWH